jgi:hypothetical protein
MKYILSIAIILLCTSCEHTLDVANGMLSHSYSNENFQGISLARHNETTITKDTSHRKTTMDLDTSGQEQKKLFIQPPVGPRLPVE